jgi:hypothetical protein
MIFPSIAFVIVGLAAMYVLHLHLLRKDTFLAKAAEIASAQAELKTQLHEIESTKQELKKLRDDISGINLRLHISKGSR